MRTVMRVATALLAGAACLGAMDGVAAAASAKISLAEARGQIGKAATNPADMKAIMRQLSASDQCAYLADVNAAIAKMPSSEFERTAAFVAADRAALEVAKKGNVKALIAEIFATTPIASLPAMTESLSSDLMNRATARGQTYTDEQYAKLAESVMAEVNARVAQVDHSDVRSGFAALMFIRGSNSREASIVDPIVAALPVAAQNVAKTEWFPSALAEPPAKSYDPMLAAGDVDELPEEDPSLYTMLSTIRVTGPQLTESLLADLTGLSTDPNNKSFQKNPIVDAEMLSHRLPGMTLMEDSNAAIGWAIEQSKEPYVEPSGYPGQRTHR